MAAIEARHCVSTQSWQVEGATYQGRPGGITIDSSGILNQSGKLLIKSCRQEKQTFCIVEHSILHLAISVPSLASLSQFVVVATHLLGVIYLRVFGLRQDRKNQSDWKYSQAHSNCLKIAQKIAQKPKSS
jgi:hypothetical protein